MQVAALGMSLCTMENSLALHKPAFASNLVLFSVAAVEPFDESPASNTTLLPHVSSTCPMNARC